VILSEAHDLLRQLLRRLGRHDDATTVLAYEVAHVPHVGDNQWLAGLYGFPEDEGMLSLREGITTASHASR